MRSKKQSAAKPPDGTVFFLDRSLGVEPIRTELIKSGLKVEIHDEHFARDEEDRVWLRMAGERGWVVLTKDQKLRYRPLEIAALRASSARVFVLTAGNLRGIEIAAVFLEALPRRLNAIAEAHKAVGVESTAHNPIVAHTMKGIRRTLGTAAAQKSPTLTDDIRTMVDGAEVGLIGARDRALVLLGFAGAFRRSELVGLDVEDCAFGKDGLTVTLRRSKTDQDRAGRKIGIPYGANPETCPVRTVQGWMEQAGITFGPLFRSITSHGHLRQGRLSGIDVARVLLKSAACAVLAGLRLAMGEAK